MSFYFSKLVLHFLKEFYSLIGLIVESNRGRSVIKTGHFEELVVVIRVT